MEKERCDVVAVPDMPIEEVLTLALYEVTSNMWASAKMLGPDDEEPDLQLVDRRMYDTYAAKAAALAEAIKNHSNVVKNITPRDVLFYAKNGALEMGLDDKAYCIELAMSCLYE